MYSNNILNFQESTTIINACKKQVWKLIECTTYVIVSGQGVEKFSKLVFMLCFVRIEFRYSNLSHFHDAVNIETGV